MSRRAATAAAAVTALLLWASSPALGAGALAWVALVPVAVAVERVPAGRMARALVPLAYALYLELLLVPALPFGLADGQWRNPPLPILVGGSPVLGVALIAVPLAGLVLYALRFPRPWPVGGGRAPAMLCILVPALGWTALDFVRVKLDPGGLWGPLFLSQADTQAARLAALGGPWLITFAIVAVNYALATLVVRGRAALPAAAATGAAVVLAIALAPQAPGARGRAALTVAAVQPGYDTAEFEQPVLRHFRPGSYDLAALDMIADLGALTRAAARRGAELVVWPEAALWVDPRRTRDVRSALARLARTTGAALVVPYFVPRPAQGATLLVMPDGSFTRPQPKQRPMWFWGEDGGNRVPPRPVAAGATEIGTMLGVDNGDPGPARRLADSAATLITSSTHDWRALAAQQRAFAQLHARESRRPLVRADWRYGSAIFDRGGRRVADAGTVRRRTVVLARVTPAAGSTPYVRLGDAVGWAALATALLALGSTAVAALGKRPASPAPAASPRRRRRDPWSPA